MNKLEKLLEELVKDAPTFHDEYLLLFTLNKKTSHETNIVFKRNEREPFCLINCYCSSDKFGSASNNNYAYEPFEFSIPMLHIHSFIQKYVNEEHFLLCYPKNFTVLSANIYYNELLKKVDSNKNISSLFLLASLTNDLPNNLEQAKKIKI